MLENIKNFFISRPLLRFYRVSGYGIFSVVLVGLLELVPQLTLPGAYESYTILILTAILNAVDKKYRDLKAN